MHKVYGVCFALTLGIFNSLATAQSEPLCGTTQYPSCPKNQVCIRPAPNVRCAGDQIATCPGVCKPACTLKSFNANNRNIKSTPSCPFGLPCTKPAYPVSNPQLGFCPDPAFCGGIAAFKCESADDICIDDPRDDCDPKKGGADCGGICVPGGGQQCGAKTGKTCPQGYDCVENTWDDCDPKKGFRDCPGVCVKNPPTEEQPTDQTCGGITGKVCQTGYRCVDNPKDGCDPKKGGADCSGLCVKKAICATLSGIQCPKGQKCVDDNEGDCTGGIAADCPGVCVES